MLVIRREQMSVLNRKFEAKFRQAVADYLISDYPAYVRELGAAGIDNLIDQGIRKAAGLGLEYEAQICDLIAIMAVHGVDFDRLPWASDILSDRSEPSAVLIGRLNGWSEALRQIKEQARA